MSVQRPSLWRVLSTTSRIISSNSLHFAALAVLFIFPMTLFNIIHTLINLPPSPSPSPFNSQYRLPSFSLDKSQILYALLLLIFTLFAISSVTHSIVHGFHTTPCISLTVTASLKSILSSFLPLLATKAAYFIIMAAILFGFAICMAFILMGLMLLGFEIEPSSKPVMAVVFVMAILLLALFVYLGVKWCLMDAIVVAESKYGFAPLQRSSSLVKGARRVAFLMILLFAILQGILFGWFSLLAGSARTINGGVVLQLVVYAALSTLLLLFGLAAKTVLFVHCKEFNGEFEFQSNVKKLGQVYVQLPPDVVDHV